MRCRQDSAQHSGVFGLVFWKSSSNPLTGSQFTPDDDVSIGRFLTTSQVRDVSQTTSHPLLYNTAERRLRSNGSRRYNLRIEARSIALRWCIRASSRIQPVPSRPEEALGHRGKSTQVHSSSQVESTQVHSSPLKSTPQVKSSPLTSS